MHDDRIVPAFAPACLNLGHQELAARARRGLAVLADCRICPRD
jgi:hypothetical protein